MDFPLEILGALGSSIVGFLFKAQANALEALKHTQELQIQKEMTADQLANSAAKRSNPVARKAIAGFVLFVIFGGLLFVGVASFWKPDLVVSMITDAERNELLWGLIKWGGGQVVTEAHGLVLPPWTGWVVSVIIGFFFGTGAAKPAR